MEETKGHIHPLSRTMDEIVRIFTELGFEVALGPEIETEHYNFDALNVPKNHPARDMQDTFWIKGVKETVLRTHTSPVQIRYMEKNNPPFRIVVPGKVFRYEATDATHETQFHQVEGLVVGENVTMAGLKWTLEAFFKKLFGNDVKIRMRPSFFPFVEPGVEVDVSCFLCSGVGCNVCKRSGWIEVMGGGMVHPNVLQAGGIDPRKYSGLAFGMGVDRLVMIKYGIEDVRLLYAGDLRLVNQF
ncbi:MAG: phenylalanine--tRNA ligase subunit alpha [Candidatus Yonathbacteria bacterium RIFCSPHIGHO2_01_FULL_44_41]|uniref:phenylalanine--tRNA ligase n=1 Tax=Candidatus Yonathbacteria bacterium RIFCSPHIGHO2_02_FULL_44_14 TaxID=1802724 RepID=A0A1G2SBE4_9BACT|nr:MAG: phenylalanine--tRNA ligase subunit alpha [Candidatus Yonathbacteria bacterium RIFCSPHIGHO2_01_FULL_44_41]OHA80776.1 MAG: phenylalanine--tRNA ligase subunit alpha [Candidatus Yonathbacteria bacterium RIFCSPLOWO2_01_FULL_43_20]OHA82009.1 MAG: phenylalanine--tRNA ligase subunit alpha [Candidatus Yonathbacteria bacterium RIFCSPHIGHO2_02_FULL_44_14]